MPFDNIVVHLHEYENGETHIRNVRIPCGDFYYVVTSKKKPVVYLTRATLRLENRELYVYVYGIDCYFSITYWNELLEGENKRVFFADEIEQVMELCDKAYRRRRFKAKIIEVK